MFAAKVLAVAAPLLGLAAAAPTQARDLDWGNWTLTDIKGVLDPSNTYIEFNLTDDNIPGTVVCYATLSDQIIGPDQPYFPCKDNDAVKFTTNTNLSTIYVSRKLYQTEAIVQLNGSAPLVKTEIPTNSGSDFTAADVTIHEEQTDLITSDIPA